MDGEHFFNESPRLAAEKIISAVRLAIEDADRPVRRMSMMAEVFTEADLHA